MRRDDRPPPLQIRAFTSDSYEAIKKRERKKSDRREQNKAEQWSSAWAKEDTGTSAGAVAMQEVTRMDSRPVHSGGSRTEPLVIQEDDKFQYRFSSHSAASISPLEDPRSGRIQCLAAPASPATSPQARGSEARVCAGAEQGWEICHNGVRDPRAASHDVRTITADGHDVGTSDQQLHIQTRNDTGLAVESPSYPTLADSSAEGCSELCEQLIESRYTRSPGRASLEPNLAPVGAGTTGLEWLSSTHVADGALAEALPDEPSHTVGVARNIGSHTRRARSEQAGSIYCKSTSQSAWTSGQDEQLIHLRDTAQLNWRNIVNYFPEMTLDAVKGRYKHLKGSRMVCQTVSDVPKPRIQMHIGTTYLASSIPQKAAKKCRAPSRTKSRQQPISILREHYSTPRRRYATKRAKPIKYVPSLAVAIHEDVYQRTSRCGRPIRHPFRHLPSEGYV